MANIFAGTEPPAWLERMTAQKPGQLGSIVGELVASMANSSEIAIDRATTKQAQGVDTNWIKELPASIKPGLAEARLNMQNPLWRMQAQQAQLNMAQQGLQIQNQQSLIDLRKQKLQMQEHDQDVLPKWLQEHPTWESRQDADPPMLYTTEGQRMYRDVGITDAANIKHKTVTEGISAYSKAVAQLQKLDPIAAAPFATQIGKIPTPEMSGKLSAAMAAAEEKQKQEQEPHSFSVQVGGKTVAGYMDKKGFHVVNDKNLPENPTPFEFNVGDQTVKGYIDKRGFHEVKPKGATPPKLSTAQTSELTYARNRVQGLEKAMLDPANKNRESELRNQWMEARKYYNGLLKKYSPDESATAAPAPTAQPAGASKRMTYNPDTDQLSPY